MNDTNRVTPSENEKKTPTSTILKAFGMTRPGIELWRLAPEADALSNTPQRHSHRMLRNSRSIL